MQRAFWISFVATVGVYLLMLFWTLPLISTAAGGLPPFDLRPFGYTAQDAQTFLGALSEEGRRFYLYVQLRLDLVLPAVLGIMLIVGFQRVYQPPWNTVFSVVALIMVSADYLENYMVATILQSGGVAIDSNVVAFASFWTQCKAAAAVVAFGALLWGSVAQVRRSWA